jgi:PKD repeat protein
MIKKVLLLEFFLSSLFLCGAQKIIIQTATPFEMDSVQAKQNEEVVIDFEVLHKYGCESLITQLINHTIYPFEDSLAFFWNLFNDEQTLSYYFEEENPDVFINEPGNYHVKLIVSDFSGFIDSIIKFNIVSIDKMPQIDFTFTPEDALFAEYLGEVEFSNLTDPKFLKDTTIVWYWDMGDNVIYHSKWAPVHLFSSWGDYHTTFHLKTKNGCKAARTKTVSIEDELFFSDRLLKNFNNSSAIFAITNLNTNIPIAHPTEFRTNYLFIYNDIGEIIYEQKNYDSYIKNNVVVKGKQWLSADYLPEGTYYYSFYYKGKNKMVHYKGEFVVVNNN